MAPAVRGVRAGRGPTNRSFLHTPSCHFQRRRKTVLDSMFYSGPCISHILQPGAMALHGATAFKFGGIARCDAPLVLRQSGCRSPE